MSANADSPLRRNAIAVASFALAGGVAQILATIALNMQPREAVRQAAAEGPFIYIIAALVLAAGAVVAWMVRRKMPIFLGVLVLWPVIEFLALRRFGSALGLAYHGEFILHYFNGLLGLLLVGLIPYRWWRLGTGKTHALRVIPLGAALGGASLLGLAHASSIPVLEDALNSPWITTIGTGLLLAAWLSGLALFWNKLRPPNLRVVSLLLAVPVVLRASLAGVHGLSGEPVGDGGKLAVGASIVLVSAAVFVLFRPKLELWLRALIWVVGVFAAGFAYLMYKQNFGHLDGDLGDLLASLFGFRVPYPQYVDEMKSWAMCLAIFFMLSTVYAALVAPRERVRGAALALFGVAGIGLASPHLTLMLFGGALLFLDTLVPGEVEPATGRAPEGKGATPEMIESALVELADRLGMDDPIILETEKATVVDLSGDTVGTRIDIRARVCARTTTLDLVVGVVGRDSPLVSLVPDPSDQGQRPAHLLARTHRLTGSARALETLGDAPLDALIRFPHARLELWTAGARVELGPPSASEGVDVDALETLVRILARQATSE